MTNSNFPLFLNNLTLDTSWSCQSCNKTLLCDYTIESTPVKCKCGKQVCRQCVHRIYNTMCTSCGNNYYKSLITCSLCRTMKAIRRCDVCKRKVCVYCVNDNLYIYRCNICSKDYYTTMWSMY